VGVYVNSIRLDVSKKAVSFFLEGERPDISQSFVLDYPIALDSVHCHSASIVNFREGTKGLVVGWSNNVNLVACPD
jgi:hypothetical protein